MRLSLVLKTLNLIILFENAFAMGLQNSHSERKLPTFIISNGLRSFADRQFYEDWVRSF